jgi:hypothetical protein
MPFTNVQIGNAEAGATSLSMVRSMRQRLEEELPHRSCYLRVARIVTPPNHIMPCDFA